MYFPYFHSFITFLILAISRSNFAQIKWSWTFFNSQDDELFKNVQDFRIWVKFDRGMVKNFGSFFLFTLYFRHVLVENQDTGEKKIFFATLIKSLAVLVICHVINLFVLASNTILTCTACVPADSSRNS